MKRKRVASISMAHIEDIGELEGKKSLFEDILVFFKAITCDQALFSGGKGETKNRA